MKRLPLVCIPVMLFIFNNCGQILRYTPAHSVPAERAVPRATSTAIPTVTMKSTIDPTGEWINNEIEDGIEQGERIIKAIESYHQDYGNYPESLTGLIPEYLNEIPLTIAGQEYTFELFEPNIYLLSFIRIRTHIGQGKYVNYCAYLRNINEWECASYHK